MGKRLAFMGAGAVAFVCTKSYDTVWATALISQYLAPDGFVVSLQNGINEERIAGVVGWGRVVGCIASSISVNAYRAGHVTRTVQPGGPGYTVFRVGEVHGRITPRVEELARLLTAIDSARATPNLWGERWTKLVLNSMGNGVSAITGLGGKDVTLDPEARRLSIQLAGEAIAVGQALGFTLESIRGLDGDAYVAAVRGERSAFEQVEASMLAGLARMTDEGRPSTGQDIQKGRRTEIDFLNGLVADKGAEAGVLVLAGEAVLGVDAVVLQLDRHPLDRPLLALRVQEDRHCGAGAERAEQQLVRRRALVGAPDVRRLVRDDHLAARHHLLLEVRSAPDDDAGHAISYL